MSSGDVGGRVSALYDGAAAAVYARHRDAQAGVLAAILSCCVEIPAATVLEIGCGTATHLRAVREATGCRCWGIDPSPAMLGRRSGESASLHLCRARAEALPLRAGTVDLAYSVDVAHHLRDLDAAYSEMARVLRRGGVLLTATDSEATIRARPILSGYFPDTVPYELARYPTVARLEAVHARHGFEIVDSRVVEHPHVLVDARPYRERAYSCLHLISDEALASGVALLERDLPLATVSRNYVIVARRQVGVGD